MSHHFDYFYNTNWITLYVHFPHFYYWHASIGYSIFIVCLDLEMSTIENVRNFKTYGFLGRIVVI